MMLQRAVMAAVALIGVVFSVAAVTGTLDDATENEFATPTSEVRLEDDRASGDGLLKRLSRAVGVSETGPQRLHLRVPDHRALRVPAPPERLAPPDPGELRAHAYQFVSRVFDRPRAGAAAIGFVRRGTVLHASERVTGRGCKHGAWYRLQGAGFVCSRDGFAVSRAVREPGPRQPRPDLSRALPFGYGKARPHALRHHRIPSDAELAEIDRASAEGQRLPEVVERRMDGIFLLALDRLEGEEGRGFYRTVRGRYVHADDVEAKLEPKMGGELLRGNRTLPLAFVYGEGGAPLYRAEGPGRVEVGEAEPHARFGVAREGRLLDEDVVFSKDGFAAPRARVRVARRRGRPEGVAATDKWIHVDLDEQTLVAYEGDEPVFATLVSSGKGPDHLTPRGLFRVREKHISTMMHGPDPDEGYYEVQEVPWTQYYHDSFALHGAYWHDDFGNTRSHGCTNISPVDARWLFLWSDDPVPAGWNAVRKLDGTWVHLTRASSVDPDDPDATLAASTP